MRIVLDYYSLLTGAKQREAVRKVQPLLAAPHDDVEADKAWLELPDVDRESALQLHLDNGSRIIGLPENERTIRGYSGVAMLIIDEAARVNGNLFRAVRPMLARSRGRIVALSTPFGQREWFWDLWDRCDKDMRDGRWPAWQRIRARAVDCPHFPAGFLEEELLEIGEHWWRQEYGVEFLQPIDAVFPLEKVRRMRDDSVAALWPMTKG